MPKALLADQPTVLATLGERLRREGFEVREASTGVEALRAAASWQPDVVVLDVGLPDLSGLEVCRRLKGSRRTAAARVLLLGASGAEADRVAGFEAAADDYVTKPFSLPELALRLRALLRTSAASPFSWRVVLDRAEHRCLVDGRNVKLTLIEYRLLDALIGAQGRVLSQEDLLRQVWRVSTEIESRTVHSHMNRLRNKLGAARGCIQTIRRVGYRYVDREG